jgi:Skp family chaperone for outer membrane proteins
MKIITIILASIITILAISNANAEGVGIINVEKVSKESKAVVDVQGKIAKKQDEFQKEINKKQSELASEKKKLESKKSAKDSDKEKEQKNFQKKVVDLKDFAEQRQAILKKGSSAAMAVINDKMKEIIADIAKDKKLTVIVPASQTSYFDEDADISSEVISKLNKELTKVDVKF